MYCVCIRGIFGLYNDLCYNVLYTYVRNCITILVKLIKLINTGTPLYYMDTSNINYTTYVHWLLGANCVNKHIFKSSYLQSTRYVEYVATYIIMCNNMLCIELLTLTNQPSKVFSEFFKYLLIKTSYVINK